MNRSDRLLEETPVEPVGGWAYLPGPNGTTLRVAAALDRDDPLREIPASCPDVRPSGFGDVATVVERGYKPENQDASFVAEDGASFGVVDGLGGPMSGEVAAKILASALRGAMVGGFKSREVRACTREASAAMRVVHDRNVRLFQMELNPCGAVFVAGRVRPGFVDVWWAGDAQAFLLPAKAKAVMTTPNRPDPKNRAGVAGQVTALCPGNVQRDTWRLHPGDLLILATDGLTDNVDVALEAAVLAGKDAATVAEHLAKAALKRMEGPRIGDLGGKCDNVAVQACRYLGKTTP